MMMSVTPETAFQTCSGAHWCSARSQDSLVKVGGGERSALDSHPAGLTGTEHVARRKAPIPLLN